jgi:hypothetical protein
MTIDVARKKRIKKFYYLSLLCLFPGLGILIGIVLLVYAVFVFRNIKLILFIILTMAGGYGIMKLDSAHLRHEMLYGKDSENEYSLLARSELDDIVRNLELYRVKHQRYPDSLKQLEKDNPGPVFIIDPLQARNHARNPITYKFIYFYYTPKDTTYELFSAGVDGIPHTQDDIYPQRPLK